MRNFFTLWRRELHACFLSPIAYVTMVLYLSMSGWIFLQAALGKSGVIESLEVILFMSIFFWIPALTTVIAMRLFAEEKRLGTLETLMTAPVTDRQVVMGKYAGALSFLMVTVLPSVAYLFMLTAICPGDNPIDAGGMAGGLGILVLVSAFSMAIGLMVSILTKNQIIAAICIFCAVCLPFFAKPMISVLPVASERLLEFLSVEAHILDFARGSIDTRPIVLHLSGTVFVLFVAVRLLEVRRWK